MMSALLVGLACSGWTVETFTKYPLMAVYDCRNQPSNADCGPKNAYSVSSVDYCELERRVRAGESTWGQLMKGQTFDFVVMPGYGDDVSILVE